LKTLANIKANATRGINTYDYDLSVEESAATPYELYLNKVKKEDDKTIRLKKAKNEKYYLQPGKYKVELTKSGQTKEVDLLIE